MSNKIGDNHRDYERTHPWISFSIDMNRISAKIWMALGEAKSKCEHIANAPLQPAVAEEMHKIYMAKGVRGTTAIEGNTLSEEEIRDQIDSKLQLPPSKEYLGKEVNNIAAACNAIRDRVFDSEVTEMTPKELSDFNSIVLDGLTLEEGVVPGQLRKHSVGITGAGYRGAPAQDCEFLVDRLCEWFNIEWNVVSDSCTVEFSILKAIVAHVYIAWIHPFGDGNGRTARLLEFQILLQSGVPTPAAHLLSNYYNETRQEYYRQLEIASSSKDGIYHFIEYAVMGFVESLRIQLTYVRHQVWEVAWESYIHDLFKDKNKRTDERRRHLALDISRAAAEGPVMISNINRISPRLAEHYAGKTSITIKRDVMELQKMGLLGILEDGSIYPRKETVFSFLPRRRTAEQR